MPKLELIEDEISRKLAEAERTGELRSAPSFGKPLAADAGWDMTPDELKMPFKILRNAGIVPPEVEFFHERARLREALQSAPDEGQRQVLRSNSPTSSSVFRFASKHCSAAWPSEASVHEA